MQPSNPHLYQPPRSLSDTHYCVVGDVTVDSTAAIAPGVVLQASSGSRIVIEKGACLAGGVCLQSRQGILTICAGASLGANVLIIGHGVVGTNACVSPSSTVIDPQIEPSAIVPPCSVLNRVAAPPSGKPLDQPIGVRGGSAYAELSESTNTFVEPPPIGPRPIETPDLSDQDGRYRESIATQNGYGTLTNGVQLNSSTSSSPAASYGLSQNGSSSITVQSDGQSNGYIYGRKQVSQLISTLFPNRQSLKDS
ncbi:hypothetical protein S7335_2482 [Synechococcus sp. PCC 7335]|uniref:hypothetical protein n=1 Tax=Synechococcus sp. (strain ATCC 29403 / PCC 7335) TaxID=91464 RepID=UPI00017EB127|nr:hypothetical protein [Synechococcus sp. PCC 7335]EDX84785.1 hypothetical protein S7335_2482 [Synechococcus sp. PCC 7335]